MKKQVLSLLYLFLSFAAFGQISFDAQSDDQAMVDPVKWSYKVEHLGADTFEISIIGKFAKGYHIYGLYLPENESNFKPTATEIRFKTNKDVKFIGKPIEVKGVRKVKKDPMWDDMAVTYLENEAIIKQKIQSKNFKTKLETEIFFQACDEQACFPPETKSLTIDFAKASENEIIDDTIDQKTDTVSQSTLDSLANLQPKTALNDIKFDWSKSQDVCKTEKDAKSLWMIFLLGLISGFFALLTPCVFPLLPLTVSMFLKSGKGVKMALLYGLSIILIYVFIGMFFTLVFGSTALNEFSTNVWVNIVFAIIFIIFGLSFFGLFEITLPYTWANKTDALASRGGYLGIFFMAFTLVIVSFSCTGPLVGNLLVEAAFGKGNTLFGIFPLRPLVGMLGFSMALALPFMLFAIFPKMMQSIPKSGGWLETVKKSLGFLEIALAMKFLSTADMVQNWGILRIEPFLIIWILVFLSLGLFLLGVLKFNKVKEKIGVVRAIFGILSLAFTAYLCTGFTYKPLKLLSGIAPPVHYNFWGPKNHGCPAGLDCFHDFEEGLAFAKQVNKPIMIDFTGYGCVNCRKMEETVWTDPEVNKLIQKYVLISLYVDDRKELPIAEQYTSGNTGTLKKITNVGQKWSDFEAKHFKKNSQPYYVLLNQDLVILNTPVAYTPNKKEYKDFLQCGLSNFERIEEK